MKSTEGINFNIGPMDGKKRKPEKRNPCNLSPITLEKLLIWIDAKEGIDEKVKELLKKMASTYPESALATWQKSFNKYLAKAQSIILKTPKKFVELGDEESDIDEKSCGEMPINDFDSGY